jgi:uncharacterized protein (TIGR00297 family)
MTRPVIPAQQVDPTEPNPAPARPAKAIPPNRDRLQSRLLVWIALPILCYLVVDESRPLIAAGHYPRADFFMALAVSLFFALFVWRLKAVTALGAFCGGMICFLVTESFQRVLITVIGPWRPTPSITHSGLAPLFLLFALTFEATRLKRERKEAAGLAESRRGRTAAQVIANLSVAALMASQWGEWIYDLVAGAWAFDGQHDMFVQYTAVFLVPMLAALAEATADTVSSEIGQAFGGTPFMLTTLRCVPPGTDGAISRYGTLAGIAAAAIIAATGAPALGMSPAACAVAFIAGIAGLFFDSLLGATIERRGWINNDLVNFTSTAFAATLALLAIRFNQYNLFR